MVVKGKCLTAILYGAMFIAGNVLAAAPDVGDAPATAAGKPGMFGFMFPFLLIFVIFYFLIISPQRKQQKETEKMQTGLKKGDRVITTSGIHGTVWDFKEPEKVVVLDVAPNVRMSFSRNAIASVKKDAQSQITAK